MELDLQVGDRVTYKYKDENDSRIMVITSNNDKVIILDDDKEILKIERPQYEEIYKKGVTTHHVTIETDKLKELILENNNYYRNLSLKTKITLVKQYAEFDNDTDLLKFLELMEE